LRASKNGKRSRIEKCDGRKMKNRETRRRAIPAGFSCPAAGPFLTFRRSDSREMVPGTPGILILEAGPNQDLA
jgi:hypothetical protein